VAPSSAESPWRTTIAGSDPIASPDLVNRDFTASVPNRTWVADFTYIRCWEGVVFFSFVLDVYSRRLVGWQFAGHMRTELVQDALDMAVAARRPPKGTIHHSDHGGQPGLNRSSQHRAIGDATVAGESVR
jgi:transposase InsO family protein